MNEEQCNDGLGTPHLFNKCVMYGSTCMTRCEVGESDVGGVLLGGGPCVLEDTEEGESYCLSRETETEVGIGIGIGDGCDEMPNMRYCEDSGLLLGVRGMCSWIKAEGVERCIEKDKSERCDYYSTMSGCEKTINGETCVWIKKWETYECVEENEADWCEYYINSDDCKMTKGGRLCMWVGECREYEENCSDIGDVTNESECENYNSKRGTCFYNGNWTVGSSDIKCSDVVDITECSDLFEDSVCMDANNDIYPNLMINININSSSSLDIYYSYCEWDEIRKKCVIKREVGCKEVGMEICDTTYGCTIINGIVYSFTFYYYCNYYLTLLFLKSIIFFLLDEDDE
jgi:hypothetical protein